MEKAQVTKIGISMLLLAALAGIGFGVSYFMSSSEPQPADIVIEGEPNTSLSTLEEKEVENVRDILTEKPVPVADGAEVREELAQPLQGGGLTEVEKQRIRAELSK